MPETWKEVDRIPSPFGSEDRAAVEWWVSETKGFDKKWKWEEILVGTFTIDDDPLQYVIRLGGVSGDSWVFFSRERPVIIAVDFDGTIVEHEYPAIGKPVPGAFKWMKLWQEAGAELILWTMRGDSPDGPMLTQAVEFCQKHGVEFYAVNENPTQKLWTNSPKCYAQIYVDDAAYGCPLRESKKFGARPMVDWEIVGPAILFVLAPQPEGVPT